MFCSLLLMVTMRKRLKERYEIDSPPLMDGNIENLPEIYEKYANNLIMIHAAGYHTVHTAYDTSQELFRNRLLFLPLIWKPFWIKQLGNKTDLHRAHTCFNWIDLPNYPMVHFWVQKVCERVFGTWWYMHKMIVLVQLRWKWYSRYSRPKIMRTNQINLKTH